MSALCFLLGVSFVLNATYGQWAFNFSEHGGKWIALDVVIGVAFFVASFLLWRGAKRRELEELIRQHGYPEALDHFDPSK